MPGERFEKRLAYNDPQGQSCFELRAMALALVRHNIQSPDNSQAVGDSGETAIADRIGEGKGRGDKGHTAQVGAYDITYTPAQAQMP